MGKYRGFSLVNLMAVVAIIGIFAIIALPIYNQYIERTKVAKEIPSIGTYKQDVASCFMKKDSLEDCNDGESGIHKALNDEGNIISLNVIKGDILLVINAENHVVDVSPIELLFAVNPDIDGSYPTLDWTLFCNDYTSEKNSLVKECQGVISDKDNDGYNDSIEDEWGSDPLDPNSVPENWDLIETLETGNESIGKNYTSDWRPEIDSQKEDFPQTRSYDEGIETTYVKRERDTFSGNIREEEYTVTTRNENLSEQRIVNVNLINTEEVGDYYDCGNWTPLLSDTYKNETVTQEADCKQKVEKTYEYTSQGLSESRTFEEEIIKRVTEINNGTKPLEQCEEKSYSEIATGNSIYWRVTSDYLVPDSVRDEKYRTIKEACEAGIARKVSYWKSRGDYKFRSVGGIDNRAGGGSYTWNNWGKMPADSGFNQSSRTFYCNHEYKKPNSSYWLTFWPYSGADVRMMGYNCPAGTSWSSANNGCMPENESHVCPD